MTLDFIGLRHGAVLNHRHGRESAEGLQISVRGLAPIEADVSVNGVPARRDDRIFTADLTLTRQTNTLEAVLTGETGRLSRTIQVIWDKKSFPRYNFFIDDHSFFLTDIARSRPASLFDHFYLKALRETHRRYGTRFTLNLFYHNDHDQFCLADFPDAYRGEFSDAADWLRLSFHAYGEFPDRPYQYTTAEKLAADYDLVQAEICRFAGPAAFIVPPVLHWAMLHPDLFHVLRERGCRMLSGSYVNSQTAVGQGALHEQVTDIGYFKSLETGLYLQQKRACYDFAHDLCFVKNHVCCNLHSCAEIAARLQPLFNENPQVEIIGLASHEQYSFPRYHNYIADHHERIDFAARLASEAGYRPVFFNEGFLGNPEQPE